VGCAWWCPGAAAWGWSSLQLKVWAGRGGARGRDEGVAPGGGALGQEKASRGTGEDGVRWSASSMAAPGVLEAGIGDLYRARAGRTLYRARARRTAG
jgi:hypothetical protein